MSLLSPLSRSRAEDFAADLDAGSSTDPTVRSLYLLAGELAALPVDPDPRFRAQLRQQLVTTALEPPPRVVRTTLADRLAESLSGWRGQRRLAFAACLVVVVLLVGAVGLLGSRSVPGEPFYAAKRAAESVQLATAHGKLAKGHRHLQFAATRLREVSVLVGRSNALGGLPGRPVAGRLALSERTTQLVLETLADMDRETLVGTRDLTEYWRESGEQRPLQALDAFATGQGSKLVAVLPALPVSARTPAMQAMNLITSVQERAQALIAQGPCDEACQQVAGGATMSGGFDVLGPVPCPTICPGSGGAQAPAAAVTTVAPTPGVTLGPSTAASPDVTQPASPLPTPSLSPSPAPVPTESLSPTPSQSAAPSASPSPVESTSPTTSPSPSPSASLSPEPSPSGSATAGPTDSPSPSPSPSDPSASSSPSESATASPPAYLSPAG